MEYESCGRSLDNGVLVLPWQAAHTSSGRIFRQDRTSIPAWPAERIGVMLPFTLEFPSNSRVTHTSD